MRKPINDHLDRVGESWGRHWLYATRCGLRLIGLGLACLAHGLFPFLFTHTASDGVRRLYGELAARRGGYDERWRG